jgi:hypothetical protein
LDNFAGSTVQLGRTVTTTTIVGRESVAAPSPAYVDALSGGAGGYDDERVRETRR